MQQQTVSCRMGGLGAHEDPAHGLGLHATGRHACMRMAPRFTVSCGTCHAADQKSLPCCLLGPRLTLAVCVCGCSWQSRLALEWREWMTSNLLGQYFADRSFYQLQAGALVDNPDQRIAADVR